MKKIAIIGSFCRDMDVSDGQSVKTRIVTQEIERAFGADQVKRIDTYGWKKNPFRLFTSCVSAVWNSDHVIFMTDAGGIKVFPWLLRTSNLTRRCGLHYVVIGGWLSGSLEHKKMRTHCLKKLDGVYVETETMRRALERKGFSNLIVMPNCKRLSILRQDELVYCQEEPYRLCIFSRVMKEKGVQDAVEAVCAVNRQAGRLVYSLDIYGQVDSEQVDWFEQLKAAFPEYIRYCGTVPYHQSVEVLKNYYALLFPTKFYTEGIPGTIIDAYAAGIPVIASRWESFDDILDEDTCIGYPFGDKNGLLDALKKAAADPAYLNRKKNACLRRAKRYAPEPVMETLISRLNAER